MPSAAGDDDGDARAGLSRGVRRVLARAQLDDLGATPEGAKEIDHLGVEGRVLVSGSC